MRKFIEYLVIIIKTMFSDASCDYKRRKHTLFIIQFLRYVNATKKMAILSGLVFLFLSEAEEARMFLHDLRMSEKNDRLVMTVYSFLYL